MAEQISIINRLRRRMHLSFSTYDPDLDAGDGIESITPRGAVITLPKPPTPPTLPPFSGDISTCEKCDHVIHPGMQYAAAFVSVYGSTEGRYESNYFGGGREAMVRDCPRCGFTWAESLPTGEPT